MDKGIDLQEIRESLQLNEAEINPSTRILPTLTYNRIFEWAAARTQDPDLGIHIAEKVEPNQFGMLGYLASNAPTVGDLCDIVERYQRVFTPDFSHTFTSTEGVCQCLYEEALLANIDSRQDTDFSFGILITTIRLAAGESWCPLRCDFTYPKPEKLDNLQRLFGSDLHFEQPANKIYFSDEVLSLTMPSGDANLLAILMQQANQLLDQLSSKDLIRHVKFLITTGIGDDSSSAENIAKHLNMSVRTLNRQLKERNINFRELRNGVVINVAKDALINTDSSITDIALMLGYSETSAFDRFFKRLTGQTPLQYRKSAL
ncbi:AraC family transcriptional regulator [Motiliproteus coralliicola]|nr:AraC family transcriptional regulator [Motiliproteus coralliicola]